MRETLMAKRAHDILHQHIFAICKMMIHMYCQYWVHAFNRTDFTVLGLSIYFLISL